ncbi:tetratricopeptide repeat protein [Oligoflexus tunisiensis]|uniref:tetratricopeptide repeat protein n=1 Tax=Oligoflexus tunisiensis TaxID=708132 RepID=UPI00159F1EF9|nr:tetratricopeptide repeat protein [Oligoflexus tunisiensis]
MPGKLKNFTLGAFLILILAGLASSCVHAPEPVVTPPTEEEPPATVAAPSLELIKEPLPPAVHALLRRAQAALERQQYQEAEAHAERAYRMDGRDYRVLFMRARISLAAGAPDDAEQWAQRALGSLPVKYKGHRKQTWELIARARAARGDHAGRDEALREARSVR